MPDGSLHSAGSASIPQHLAFFALKKKVPGTAAVLGIPRVGWCRAACLKCMGWAPSSPLGTSKPPPALHATAWTSMLPWQEAWVLPVKAGYLRRKEWCGAKDIAEFEHSCAEGSAVGGLWAGGSPMLAQLYKEDKGRKTSVLWNGVKAFPSLLICSSDITQHCAELVVSNIKHWWKHVRGRERGGEAAPFETVKDESGACSTKRIQSSDKRQAFRKLGNRSPASIFTMEEHALP